MGDHKEDAMVDLHLAMEDDVLSSIVECRTAKKVWGTLTQMYKVKSPHNKSFLKRKLHTPRMTESTIATEHINTLKTLFSQLYAMDYEIKDQERDEILLQSLPDSNDHVIINLKRILLMQSWSSRKYPLLFLTKKVDEKIKVMDQLLNKLRH